MIEESVDKKLLYFSLVFSLFIIFLYFLRLFLFSKDFFVMCDVGQGDAFYFRLEGKDLLIDTGPSKDVLYCLGKNMPFWDKKIEMIIITHPQKDHYGGLSFLLDRYFIDTIVLPSVVNEKSEQYLTLLRRLESYNRAKKEVLFSGDSIQLGDYYFYFLWPEKQDILNHREFFGFKGDSLYYPKDNLNNYSYIISLTKGNQIIGLFTGDADGKIVDRIIDKKLYSVFKENLHIKYLKVPHHGSNTGILSSSLKLAKFDYALISVGKNNPYGHPSQYYLRLLTLNGLRVFRTDVDGMIHFKLD